MKLAEQLKLEGSTPSHTRHFYERFINLDAPYCDEVLDSAELDRGPSNASISPAIDKPPIIMFSMPLNGILDLNVLVDWK